MCHTAHVTLTPRILPPKICLLAVTTGLLLGVAPQSTEAQETPDAMEVVVVSGRQPGPPLWKVTHGENTLWVLPLVPVVPGAMDWDEGRVASIIAASDEVIDPPGVSIGVSKLLLLNPLNWIRGPRLYDRLSHNSGKKTLREVLPPALWERYAALQQRYFPQDTEIETLRPSFAIAAMSTLILGAEKLTGSRQIEHRVEKLVGRRPSIRRTRVEVEEKMEGSYGELSARLQRLVDSLPEDDELACFDTQLELYERHVDDMKRVANAWATGNARDIESYSRLGEMEDPCTRLLLASSEGGYMEELIDQSSLRWLAAAETALAHNRTTFAMLPMIHMAGALSLIDRLEARGYAVRAPQ
jgi:hypothetical protein